jgi:tetratricopeptide (TPR) repeat protein
MKQFALADVRHLDAVDGWLGLGDPESAKAELEAVSVEFRAHPEFLHRHWEVCSALGDWKQALEVATLLTEMQPKDARAWLHRSYALHELKRTVEAKENLLSVVKQFSKYSVMFYNLGCYECQLGNEDQSLVWLKKAFALPGGPALRAGAMEDPDLIPLKAKLPDL